MRRKLVIADARLLIERGRLEEVAGIGKEWATMAALGSRQNPHFNSPSASFTCKTLLFLSRSLRLLQDSSNWFRSPGNSSTSYPSDSTYPPIRLAPLIKSQGFGRVPSSCAIQPTESERSTPTTAIRSLTNYKVKNKNGFRQRSESQWQKFDSVLYRRHPKRKQQSFR